MAAFSTDKLLVSAKSSLPPSLEIPDLRDGQLELPRLLDKEGLCLSTGYGIEVPLVRHAFERMHATIGERESASCDEVLDSRGNQHLR